MEFGASWGRTVGPKDTMKLLGPPTTFRVKSSLDARTNGLIGCLSLAVPFRIRRRGVEESDSELGAQSRELFADELRPIIRNYRIGDVELGDYVSPNKSSYDGLCSGY